MQNKQQKIAAKKALQNYHRKLLMITIFKLLSCYFKLLSSCWVNCEDRAILPVEAVGWRPNSWSWNSRVGL
jgi:hypothetical protein